MYPCFITDEYSQDLSHAIQFARSSALRGIELRSLWGFPSVADLPVPKLQEAKSRIADAELVVVAVDSFVFKANYSTTQSRQNELALAQRTSDAAAALSSQAIRIFAFWAEGAPELPYIADEVRRVAEVAASRGLQVWVENGTFSSVGCGVELARLLALVDRPDVFALWDPSNVLNGGWPRGIRAGLGALAGKVAHVHVKNPIQGSPGDMVFGPLHAGLVDWSEQISLLRCQGYSGALSLETHWRSDKVLRGRTVLDFPGGDTFSNGGEEATELMLLELTTLLSETHGMRSM